MSGFKPEQNEAQMAPPDSGPAPSPFSGPGENCCAAATAKRVGFLVDGEEYFAAFMRAAERAERSILILAWDFDSRTVMGYDEQNVRSRRWANS
jgi:phosphatidylserine/phosphatidylglycerophosphate/cardiolipin synthase-like enzyme